MEGGKGRAEIAAQGMLDVTSSVSWGGNVPTCKELRCLK